jgi:predicted Zn-ribbon and HTH transcriptional regulator
MATLFFSYSHRDETLRDELEIHLAMLKRQGAITTWHDRRIGAGKEFDNEISHYLDKADIILLLVSPDFLASDYCYDVEMARALERHRSGDARVIPVILRPCDWQSAPFGKLLAAPKDGKPVIKYPSQDDAFLEVVSAIRAAANGLHSPGPAEVQATLPQTTASRPVSDVRSSNLRLTEISKGRGETMVVAVLKCQICGKQFEAEMLDRDNPNERRRHGTPIRCPKCNSTQIELLRTLRRVRSAG